jgi:hypothetical protein
MMCVPGSYSVTVVFAVAGPDRNIAAHNATEIANHLDMIRSNIRSKPLSSEVADQRLKPP